MHRFAVWGVCALLFAVAASGQVSVTTLGSPYSAPFDSLNGTNLTWTDNVALPGWYAQFGAAATPAAYVLSTGTSATGALYSFGNSADRALGSIGSGTTTDIYWAVRFTNNTGATITSLAVTYTGEEWRQAGCQPAPCTPAAQTVDFQYRVTAAGSVLDANNPATGWLDHDALDFTSPQPGTTATAAALDGNLAANRTVRSSTIAVTVNSGQEVWLRWKDINHANNDHGLAIDELTVTANGVPPTPTLSINNPSAFEGDSGQTTLTFTASLSSPAPAGGVSFSIATQDNTAIAGDDYVANSAAASIASGAQTYVFSVTVNGDTVEEPDETFRVNVTSIVGTTNTSALATGTIKNDDSPTPPTGVGSANPATVAAGGTTTLTVTVTSGVKPASTGITVAADLSSIGGESEQAFTDNGNGTFSFSASVGMAIGAGAKSLPVTITDAQGRSSTTSIALTTLAGPVQNDHVVISQIYGGNGNVYRNDYVELFNPTSQTFNLTGWSIQYASAGGTTWAGTFNPVEILVGTIGPGEYYLISLAESSSGAALPTPNVQGITNMSGTAGKIALVRNTVPLSGACPLSDPDIVDFLGYGSTANCFEGNNPSVNASATLALFRTTETNDNAADFVTGAPNPLRTAPLPEFRPFVSFVDPSDHASDVPRDGSMTVTFSELVNVDSSWFDIDCVSTDKHNDATIAGGGKTFVIIPNVNFQPNEECTVTILASAVHDQDTNDADDTDTMATNFVWMFTVVPPGTPPPAPPAIHLAMGNPTFAEHDLNTPNNFLMQKDEYALSYNRDRGIANWVSWHLSTGWVGTLSRVDTFRADPAVPAEWYRVLGTDYSGSGFDRGHMVPNADRDKETSRLINQATFLMTNIIPQAPDNNQGPWADLENDLRTLLLSGSDLYIVAGGAGTGGSGSGGAATTIANGHVNVPAQTWKVALVVPAGTTPGQVAAAAKTIAVIMPNTQGIRNNDWHQYLVTVDAVEGLTGYNFFSNVPDAVENAIEAGKDGVNPPGVADQSVPATEDVAKVFTLDAAGSGSLTYTILSNPAHGQLSGAGGSRTYTPAPNFNGTDSFTYTVSNGVGSSGTATVTIDVHEVNDTPNADAQSVTLDEDASTSITLTGNDVETASNALVFTITTNPAHGVLSGVAPNVAYTPAPNYYGPDNFAFTVSDGGELSSVSQTSTAAVVSISVDPVNDAPTAVADAKNAEAGSPLVFGASELLANDTAGPANESSQTLIVTSVNAGTHGLVSLINGQLTFTPEQHFVGLGSFTYVVCDNGLTAGQSDPKCATGTAAVTIADTTAPMILDFRLVTTRLWPANHKMVDVALAYSVSDGGDAAPSCSVSVASNEPIDGTGDGDTSPDWEVVDSHHVRLRAERAGNGAGRIYTITVDCVDDFTNAARANATASVPLNMKP